MQQNHAISAWLPRDKVPVPWAHVAFCEPHVPNRRVLQCTGTTLTYHADANTENKNETFTFSWPVFDKDNATNPGCI